MIFDNTHATKEELWRSRTQEFQRSGLTRKEFCNHNGYSYQTLNYWIKKFALNPTSTSEDTVFVPLPTASCFADSSTEAPITIQMDAITIKISNSCQPDLLLALLGVICSYG